MVSTATIEHRSKMVSTTTMENVSCSPNFHNFHEIHRLNVVGNTIPIQITYNNKTRALRIIKIIRIIIKKIYINL